MTTLDDLIARLSAAAGASRELDAEIAVAVGWTTRPGFPYPWLSPDGCAEIACPAYTGSLDAAMTLRDRDNWPIMTLQDMGPVMGWSARVAIIDTSGDQPIPIMHDGQSATPALALCIAALKARKARP